MTSQTTNQQKHAVLVFLIKDDEILLAESNYRVDKITWNGISGYIENKETPNEAAVRELYEEIKVRVYAHDLEKTGVMHLYTIHEDGSKTETLTITIFICEKWQGEPTYTPGVKPQWFLFSDIPYKDMFEDTEVWLPRILDGEQIIIEAISQVNAETQHYEIKDVLVRGLYS